VFKSQRWRGGSICRARRKGKFDETNKWVYEEMEVRRSRNELAPKIASSGKRGTRRGNGFVSYKFNITKLNFIVATLSAAAVIFSRRSTFNVQRSTFVASTCRVHLRLWPCPVYYYHLLLIQPTRASSIFRSVLWPNLFDPAPSEHRHISAMRAGRDQHRHQGGYAMGNSSGPGNFLLRLTCRRVCLADIECHHLGLIGSVLG
jgi:hypothetical protein